MVACRLVGAQIIIWTNAGTLLTGTLERISERSLAKFIHFHSRKCIWKRRQEMPAILSRPCCVKLPCVTSPRRVSWRRQVCHHCLPQRLALWQPPAGPGVTSLPAYWRLGLGASNGNECTFFLPACSRVDVLLPSFYAIDCHVMWLCIMNDIFVCTQMSNKLLLLLLSKGERKSIDTG